MLCQKDKTIISIGKRLWHKEKLKCDKRNEVKRYVMSSMRRLATLYIIFEESGSDSDPISRCENSAADMFLRSNWNHFENAVRTYSEDGEVLKYGLKTALFYLVKKSGKILKASYLISDEDDKASAVDKFVEVLEVNHDYLFGDAQYAINRSRKEKLRRPENLPLEEDINLLKEYTVSRMKSVLEKEMYEVWEGERFTELRDLVVCRLTLFNARRGGEPCRLSLEEYDTAEQDTWISKNHLQQLNQAEQRLAKKMKLAYQTGKGLHLVPVLIPLDCVEAINALKDKSIRSVSGVNENNKYLFPSCEESMNHVSGWHAVQRVCKKVPDLKKKELITATKNRHRVSTMYAMMEVPDAERQYFYKHMGHSEKINTDIYQAPLGIMELVKVGRSLNIIDGMYTF